MSMQANDCRPVGKKPALQRYLRRFFPLMALYALIVCAISGWFGWEPDFRGPLGWLIAVSPALPLGGVIWAMGRYLDEEEDEFQRMKNVRAKLIGGGLTLFVYTAWGFLEHYAHVYPPMTMMIFPAFCGLWAGAAFFVNRKYR